MTVSLTMHNGLSGLKASQKAIEVTSNNIVNVDTVGYSRKVYTQSSLVLGGQTQGVTPNVPGRVVDEGLRRQIYREGGLASLFGVREDYLSRVQDLFGEPGANNSISHTISSLQAAFEDLALDPALLVSQTQSVTYLEDTLAQLQKMGDYVQNLRVEADKSITVDVTEINSILQSIDKLNVSIARAKVMGTETAGLEDERDAGFMRLTELMDVQKFVRENGEMVIMTSGGHTMLDNNAIPVVHPSITQAGAWLTYSGGEISGIYVGKNEITREIKSGEICGLIEARDKTLPNMQAQIDTLYQQLKDQLNAIQNRGVSYPDMPSKVTGGRTYLNIDAHLSPLDNPANAQTPSIRIEGGDVHIVIFDAEGKEVASTTVVNDLGFTGGKIYDPANPHAAGSDALMSRIYNWLTSDPTGPKLFNADAGVDADGKVFIDLGTSEYTIGFRDEVSSLPGSDAKDVTIKFDADGDGVYDQDVQGFSNFFGFNDLVQTTGQGWLYDSKILAGGYVPSLNQEATLTFSDAKEINFGSVKVYPGESITSIAARINADEVLNKHVKASVVQEGSGYRLRISQIDGDYLQITEPSTATGTSIMAQLGLGPSVCAVSQMSKVNPDVSLNHDKLVRGMVQYDSNAGAYFVSRGDNTCSAQFAKVMSANLNFSQAGDIPGGIYSFTSYSSSMISLLATNLSTTESSFMYQSQLTEALHYKSEEISAVNLDQELSQLIIYEKSYAASARVITTASEMLDTLINM